jgi:hypothetical protein
MLPAHPFLQPVQKFAIALVTDDRGARRITANPLGLEGLCISVVIGPAFVKVPPHSSQM